MADPVVQSGPLKDLSHFNACVCLLCHNALHPEANTTHHAFPFFIDLSSNFIPFDDDEEEEEDEPYDDIGVTDTPPPRPVAAKASQSRKGQEVGEDEEEEDDDIYEVLPGMRMWFPCMLRCSSIHPHANK